jgi:hypothetical protein
MNPFDIMNAINDTKKEVITADNEKSYNAFIINRGLSNFIDTVFLANAMNERHGLDNKLQYDFLMKAVRRRKRFSKWAKPLNSKDLDAIKIYFKYSDEKAKEALKVLSKDQIAEIHKKINTLV